MLRVKTQVDDAYLGAEGLGIKADPRSENRIPSVAAVSLNQAWHPIYARISAVSGLSFEAIACLAKRHLMSGSHLLSDGLACFRVVNTADCQHKAVVTCGKYSNDLPQFCWIINLPGYVKTSFSGTLYAFNFEKCARHYLGAYCFRFNCRFSMETMTDRIAIAVCCCMPCTERDLRVVEACG